MAKKVERFTQRARRILFLAQEASEQMKHNAIGSEHILLGLAREEESSAGRILREMAVTGQQVESVMVSYKGRLNHSRTKGRTRGLSPLLSRRVYPILVSDSQTGLRSMCSNS
jgi:ATP-dependent Clp protease ATP-binding subunit ClpC